MNGRFFFPLFPEVSPTPTPMEERGECHCYGNLIYHKRIPFVTDMAQSSSAQTDKQEKQEWGNGVKKVTWKKWMAVCLLPQLSNFEADSQKELSVLSREL